MKKGQILIIEDNLLNLELARDLLEARGFDLQSAPTAEEGMRLARELRPEVVLMDISLPGMDGLRATEILKADPITRNLIIIAVTAHAMKGDEEAALQAGCDGYLTKPINTRTFASTITGIMESAKARRSQPITEGPL